ncbi:hypothetical protein NL676_016737 [Syzygium grande]|nr:hypothetical protein NL676_016737 [Syzygium grande]
MWRMPSGKEDNLGQSSIPSVLREEQFCSHSGNTLKLRQFPIIILCSVLAEPSSHPSEETNSDDPPKYEGLKPQHGAWFITVAFWQPQVPAVANSKILQCLQILDALW